MSTYSGHKKPHFILLVFLIMAILLNKFLIAGLAPWISGLAAVDLMVVFLDIPVYLPIIDLPAIGLFFFFYFILLLSYPSRYGASTWQGLRKKLWRAATGVLAILLCLSAGGGLFYLSNGLLSRQVRNGIDSFGVQADIYTGIPDYEIIHLRGGMLLLVCFLIGLRIFIKRTEGTKEIMELVPGTMEPVMQTQDLPFGRTVDPKIAGFQGKRRNPAEREFAELLKQRKLNEREAAIRIRESAREDGIKGRAREDDRRERVRETVAVGRREVDESPDVIVKRPRTAATPVPLVAPLRVEL